MSSDRMRTKVEMKCGGRETVRGMGTEGMVKEGMITEGMATEGREGMVTEGREGMVTEGREGKEGEREILVSNSKYYRYININYSTPELPQNGR